MLHLGGAELYEIFERLPNTGNEAAIEELKKHFDCQVNAAYERDLW